MTDITLAHTYDPVTGAYLGAVSCHPDPLEPGHWLVPAHATLTPPPVLGANEAAVWDGDAWAVVPDHRGRTAYETATGRAVTIAAVGVLPDGLTLSAPADAWDRWDAAVGAWVADPPARRAALLAALADLRWRREVGGVQVAGVAVATDRDSQSLLTGAALAAQIAALAGEPFSVNWKTPDGFVTLAGYEVLAVAQAVRAHVQAAFDAEAALSAQIKADEIADLAGLVTAWEAAA